MDRWLYVPLENKRTFYPSAKQTTPYDFTGLVGVFRRYSCRQVKCLRIFFSIKTFTEYINLLNYFNKSKTVRNFLCAIHTQFLDKVVASRSVNPHFPWSYGFAANDLPDQLCFKRRHFHISYHKLNTK